MENFQPANQNLPKHIDVRIVSQAELVKEAQMLKLSPARILDLNANYLQLSGLES